MILADKIIYLRKKNGWSQEQLAEQLNISRQSVSKWESGTSIPDLDKILKMSAIFGVSTDYLLKDEVEEEAPVEDSYSEELTGRPVSVEEANTYMELVRRIAPRIGIGTMLCILSPVILIVLGGLSEEKMVGLTENMAGGFGVAILLVMVAIGVAMLILNGMQLSKYEYLEKEQIVLQYGVQGIVEKKRAEYEPVYRTYITTGVVLCILGVVPLMIAAAFDSGDIVLCVCVGALLMFVACGVFLFIYGGMIWGAYEKLLQEGEYTEREKRLNKRTAPFAGIYWCIVTAIYLWFSFMTNDWHKTWIIWPVAGVLFAALNGIMKIMMGRDLK